MTIRWRYSRLPPLMSAQPDLVVLTGDQMRLQVKFSLGENAEAMPTHRDEKISLTHGRVEHSVVVTYSSPRYRQCGIGNEGSRRAGTGRAPGCVNGMVAARGPSSTRRRGYACRACARP